MSPPASMQSTDQASANGKPKEEPIDQQNEYEDAEKNYNPKSPRFLTIMAGMYLAIFLVALVIIAAMISIMSNVRTDKEIGQNDCCGRRSRNHQRIQLD
jgi:hypothetical protein